jgi:hypothetical protein
MYNSERYSPAAGDGMHSGGRPFPPIIGQVVRIGNEQSPYVARPLAGAHNTPLPVTRASFTQ